jgi:hypothetical protein
MKGGVSAVNGKPRHMNIDFAIKILRETKVASNHDVNGNPVRYGYQNQTYYDIARNMAVQALKEKQARENETGAANNSKIEGST